MARFWPLPRARHLAGCQPKPVQHTQHISARITLCLFPPRKMVEMVNREDTNHLIHWGSRGDTFIVEAPADFEKQVSATTPRVVFSHFSSVAGGSGRAAAQVLSEAGV